MNTYIVFNENQIYKVKADSYYVESIGNHDILSFCANGKMIESFAHWERVKLESTDATS